MRVVGWLFVVEVGEVVPMGCRPLVCQIHPEVVVVGIVEVQKVVGHALLMKRTWKPVVVKSLVIDVVELKKAVLAE